MLNDRFCVHGLDTDAANVREAREHVRSLGIHGRVSVGLFDGKRLPYVDDLVNLLIADDLGEISQDEVMRVLAPPPRAGDGSSCRCRRATA